MPHHSPSAFKTNAVESRWRENRIRKRDHGSATEWQWKMRIRNPWVRNYSACDFQVAFFVQRFRECRCAYERHGDEMGSLVSDTQSALPRHRACCNRKPGNGTRAVFVAISGTSASRERFQRVSTRRLTWTHLYLRSETLLPLFSATATIHFRPLLSPTFCSFLCFPFYFLCVYYFLNR